MRNNRRKQRIFALLLAVLLLVPSASQSVFAGQEERVIYISTTEEFLAFAKASTLDSAFVGRMVVLEADISLEGTEFLPIATFGGTFEGNGHTISGLDISASVSPAGLFGVIQDTGIVRNVIVEGTVAPSGSRRLAGGIAGQNYGRVWNCSFSGEVSGKEIIGGLVGCNEAGGIVKYGSFFGSVKGESKTGGIAGHNLGSLNDCENKGKVNTESSTANMISDTGGIAGYSEGMILSCRNEGEVGYPHQGYNVGGIVGRSCGFVSNAVNAGEVYGRKDIGGIAGQQEPDFIAGVTVDWLSRLRAEINELSRLVEVTIDDAEGTSDTVSLHLTQINKEIDSVTGEMDDLTGNMTDYADSVVAEVNRMSALVSDVVTRMKALSEQGMVIADSVSTGMAQMETGFEELKKAVELLSEFDIDLSAVEEDLGAAEEDFALAVEELKLFVDDLQLMTADMELAIDDMKDAASTAGSAMNRIGSGMSKLEQALVIGDQAAVEQAFDDLTAGMRSLAVACGDFADAAAELEQVLGEIEEEPEQEEEESGTSELPWGDIMGETGQNYEEILEAVEQMTEMLQVIRDASGKMVEPMQKMSAAGSAMGEALQIVLDAGAVLGENVSLDIDKAKQGLNNISSGVSSLGSSMDDMYAAMADMDNAMKDMQNGFLRVEKAMEHADAAREDLDGAKDELDKVSEETKRKIDEIFDQTLYAMDCFTIAGETLNRAGEEAEELLLRADELIAFLEAADPMHMEEPSEALDAEFVQLYAAIDKLNEEMEGLNQELNGQSGILSEDLRRVNEQLNLVLNTFFDAADAMEESSGEDMIIDTSEEEIDATLDGKIYDCRNEGTVYGDTCVGGIAGAMATENELDPESDLQTIEELTLETKYEQKALLQKVVNTGTVTAKKDYVGGICGRVDLGLVYRAESYGTVSSESGDYVGGIAGISGAKIKNSYVKGSLSGKNYVGGILGSAVEEAGEDTNSVVAGCYSMVEITGYTQYAGAIAGVEDGEFTGNYFVSGDMEGINRKSYTGKAEPMDYADFAESESLPEEFHQFYLRFVDGEEEVAKISFSYGDSFDAGILPLLPEKDGYFAEWAQTEFDNLRFDKTVEVIYTELLSAVPSDITREDGRPLFLLEGAFRQDDTFTVLAQEVSAEGFIMLARDIEETVLNYLQFLENGTRPEESVNYKIEEQWKLTVPADGSDTHVVRYLPKDGNTTGLDIYIRTGDDWKKTDTEVMGSYLLFTVEGESVEILVLSTLQVWWMWLLGIIVGLTILLIGVKIVMVIRARRKAKKIKEEAEVLENE